MLKITIPNKNAPELSYVIQVLIKDSLGVDYELITNSNTEDVSLEFANSIIVFKQFYFKNDYEVLHTVEKLPKKLVEVQYGNYSIAGLYGEANILHEGNKTFIFIDLLGSTYFLLTQWESTLQKGDHLGRYQLIGSTIDKLGIYKRPIINEYLELLSILLVRIGIKITPKIYTPIFTCDVDSITKYSTLRNLFGGFRHRGISKTIFKEYKASKANKANDVYYSFDYLFEKLENKGISTILYFMTGKSDDRYDTVDYKLDEPLISRIFKKVKDNKYTIGLHPNIDSWKSLDIIQDQKMSLEKHTNQEIKHVRQHYLRYDVNETWSIMQDADFKTDSSMQFEEGMGFANGICIPFKLYDLKNRKPTDVIELPLIIMKKKDYVKDVEQSFTPIKELIDIAKYHKGKFSILFHNADLETVNEKLLFEQTLAAI